MEITKDNYDMYECQIIADIENSDFVSLDLELTGLSPHVQHVLDFPDGRYSKYKAIAERYKIIQLGIVTWKQVYNVDDDNNSDTFPTFVSKPYNIYVFPDEETGYVNCEISALIFNRDHGMDFNKWIYKGVPYLNSKQVKSLTDTITEGNINLYNPNDKTKYKNIVLFRDEDKVKYNLFCKKFSEFLYSEESSVIFDKFPKFFLNYIINNIPDNILKRIYFSYERIDDQTVLKISKVSENEKKALIDAELDKKLIDLHKKKGAKNIFDAIVKKKSVLVGHNCAIDLVFTISHFGDPLPNSLKDWKQMLRNYFTQVYDTKVLFENCAEILKDKFPGIDTESSHLEGVYSTLRGVFQDSLKIVIPEGLPDYLNSSGTYHQAGYDAFVTGCAFLWMSENIKEKRNLCRNRVYLMKSIYAGFTIDEDESYIFPQCVAYCLRSVKKPCDIDLKTLIDQKYLDRIKKIHNLENYNALLVLVQLEDSAIMNEFECYMMSSFIDIFHMYHMIKFKEIIKEEDEYKKKSFK